jgi:hypothetical protein
MCHESTSVALAETIGIGKATVTLEDIHHAELLVLSGQNPGTNHPRMLTALEKAKHNGATIVAVNPLPETGLTRFDNPQTVRGLSGVGSARSSPRTAPAVRCPVTDPQLNKHARPLRLQEGSRSCA